jgi:hypothetical protein
MEKLALAHIKINIIYFLLWNAKIHYFIKVNAAALNFFKYNLNIYFYFAKHKLLILRLIKVFIKFQDNQFSVMSAENKNWECQANSLSLSQALN